jgi:hypothetical protein
MKTIFKLLGTTLTILIMNSCNKDKSDKIDFKDMDAIPIDKYYSSDNMPDLYKQAYGNWIVIGTSGGFSGGGYKKDFGYLLLKQNGIFGIIRNDSLIAYGKMILTQNKGYLLCKFNSEKSANIEICMDSEKYIEIINNDTLNLNAPCCDRFNTQLIRKK